MTQSYTILVMQFTKVMFLVVLVRILQLRHVLHRVVLAILPLQILDLARLRIV